MQYIIRNNNSRLKVEIGCDCSSALTKLEWVDRRIKISTKNGDIIRSINTVLRQAKLQVTTRWIKSHQDDNHRWEDLTRWEHLNIICDSGAKEELHRRITDNVLSIMHLPHEEWVCLTNEGKLRNKSAIQIKKACFREEIYCALNSLRSINRDTFRKIDWDSLGLALMSSTPTFIKWYVKHTSHTCGTSFLLNKIGLQETTKCQCCLLVEEKDPDHILECTNKSMEICKDLEYKKLVEWIQRQSMHDNLKIALTMFLKNDPWPHEWIEELDRQETLAFRQLQEIGLKNLLNGYIPKLFVELQEDSFMLGHSKTSGKNGRLN